MDNLEELAIIHFTLWQNKIRKHKGVGGYADNDRSVSSY